MIASDISRPTRTSILKSRSLPVVSLIAVFAAGTAAQSRTPRAVVALFYKFDRSHSQNFTRPAIDVRRKWFSAELYKLFLYELKREREYLRKNPNDKPYFGDGLPFQPIDETCKARGKTFHKELSIKPNAEDAEVGTVKVIFAFPGPCKDPDTTTYTIELIKGGIGWLIDDVLYEDGRSLKQDLKRKEY